MSVRTFGYRAARPNGAIAAGIIEARNASEVSTALAGQGLVPIEIGPAEQPGWRRRVGRREIAMAFQSLASLVSAGVPLDRAVRASAEVAGRRLGPALVSAANGLRTGKPLSESLLGTGLSLPPLVLGVLRAGEHGSRLEEALADIAQQLEAEADTAATVRHALAYPALLAVAGTIAVVVIGTVVVPRFAEMLGDMGRDLPLSTSLLLGASGVSRKYGLWAGLALSAGTALLWRWWLTPPGRTITDRWLLRTPIVGALRMALGTAAACRSMGALLSAGAPLLTALDVSGEAVTDSALRSRLAAARDRVAGGEPLTQALRRERAILPLAIHLVAVGEGSGRLGLMLGRAGNLATQEAERRVRTAVNLLEPGLVVAFGGLVAWVAAALLQAVYSIRPM